MTETPPAAILDRGAIGPATSACHPRGLPASPSGYAPGRSGPAGYGGGYSAGPQYGGGGGGAYGAGGYGAF